MLDTCYGSSKGCDQSFTESCSDSLILDTCYGRSNGGGQRFKENGGPFKEAYRCVVFEDFKWILVHLLSSICRNTVFLNFSVLSCNQTYAKFILESDRSFFTDRFSLIFRFIGSPTVVTGAIIFHRIFI